MSEIKSIEYTVTYETPRGGTIEGAPYDTLEEARAAFDAECAVFAADSEPHTVKLERVCYTYDTDADEYTSCNVLETLEVREV